MHPSYPAYGQYGNRIGYGPGYNMNDFSAAKYGNGSQPGPVYDGNYQMSSVNTTYPGYSPVDTRMYGAPTATGYGHNMNAMNGNTRFRGRGAVYTYTHDGYGAGHRGGRFPNKKKPFVGGTLESQKEWERQTLCCFFMQGKCKFAERCRFLHEQNKTLSCQFGQNCRVHGTKEKEETAEGETTRKEETEAPSPNITEVNQSTNE